MTNRAALPAALALLAAGALSTAEDPAGPSRAAVAAYGKNLRSFPQFRCAYTVTHGTAATLDDLRAGRYVVTGVREHVTVADGPRLVARGGPKKPAGDKGGTDRTGDEQLSPETWLSTGSEGMVYRPGDPVDVWKPNGRWPGNLNPLALGLSEATLSETPDTLAATPDGGQLAGDDLTANDGRPTVGVRVVARIGSLSVTKRIALDPARGHLPCRAVLSTTSAGGGGPAFSGHEVWLLDARDCGRGRFFPTRYVFFAHPVGDERQYRLTEVAVTELDPDHAPTREDLSVELPAGTGLYLHRQPEGASLTLGRDTTLHVDDLPAVVADLEARLPPARDPAVLRGLAARWWPWVAAVGAGAAAVGAGAAAVLLLQLWLTRRRPSDRGSAA